MSALFYVGCLVVATVMNKTILGVYIFPSLQFLALFRLSATIILLEIGRRLQYVKFPLLNWRIVRILWPLPTMYLISIVTGLIHTMTLTRPMAAVSRRLVTVMTLALEEKVLGIHACRSVQCSVITMMVGAIISAINEIHLFSFDSYIIILINAMITTANGVYLKKILDSEELNVWGLLYYDACLMIVPDFFISWTSNDFEKLMDLNWDEQLFWCHILISCAVDIMLAYSMMLCTQAHSALTVSAIINLWGIFVSYFMLMILGRIVMSWNIYVGLNISLTGAILFLYSRFSFECRGAGTTARLSIYEIQDSSIKKDAIAPEL